MPNYLISSLFYLTLACATVAGIAPLGAQTGPSTVLVLDGSGSMWGNLGSEKVSKFDGVKTILRQSLSTVSPDASLGLVVFGTIRRGACSDADLLAAPEPGASARIADLVDKLNPQGRGPLTLALKEAAKTIAPGPAGTIILMHDGPDNCSQDPCAAAGEIAKTHPGVPVHLISIGVEKADAKYMRCITAATGGKMFEVNDTPSLTTAIDQALSLAHLARPATPPVDGTSKLNAPADAPSGIHLTASLTPDGPPLTAPVVWQVAAEKTPAEPILSRTASALSAELAEGRYIARASYGAVRAEKLVVVGETGVVEDRVSLDAGALRIVTGTDAAPAQLDAPVFSIFPIAQNAEGAAGPASTPIWLGLETGGEIIVPAGKYAVRLEDGPLLRKTEVEIGAGSHKEARLDFGTGRLELEATPYQGGEPLNDIVFTISEDDPDARRGRRELARSADPHAAFSLPAGTYYVAAKYADTEVQERIAIGTGDNIKRTLTLDLGRLTLSALLDGTPPTAESQVLFRVMRADDPLIEVARSKSAAPNLLLPQGRYRIEARVGDLNIQASDVAEIAAGKEQKVQLSLASAEIAVTLPSAGKTDGRDGLWEIRDARGRTVLRSEQPGKTSARVAPGRYVMRASIGDRRVEQTIEVKPGEKRTVEIPTQ